MRTVPLNASTSVPLEPTGLLSRLAAWCFTHRRQVALIWLALLVVITVAGKAAGSDFKQSSSAAGTDSQRSQQFLQSHFPSQAGDTVEVVFQDPRSVSSPADQAAISANLSQIRHLPHVVSVTSPFSSQGAGQISADRQIAYAVVALDRTAADLPDRAVRAVVDRADSISTRDLHVHMGGMPVEKLENPKFGTAEGLGILAAIVILLLAFGSLIAMALPIFTAIAAVTTTFGLLDILSHIITVPFFGPELAALVGLGVGIDYALFIVTRYRNALKAGTAAETAISEAMATSGRAVVFAGSTVVLSLLGLFLLRLSFMNGAALGAILAVLLVMAASITLLPATLGFAGANIDRFRVTSWRRRPSEATLGFWRRWARQVQRRPVVAGGSALLALVVLALPFVSLRLGAADAGTDPTTYTTRQAFDELSRGFGPGSNGPLVVALQLPTSANEKVAATLAERIEAQPDVAAVNPPRFNDTGTAAVINVIPKTAPQDSQTTHLVKALRDQVIPGVITHTGVRALVGGETAATIDLSNLISNRLALVLAFVILLSIILLTAAFRSPFISVTSALLTLLSTGVAYGLVVAVFQWGWFGSSVDQGTLAPVDSWVPVMLFTILFGLSMDYQVFLVSRIREERRSAQNDSQAVVTGLASTGRVITSAAAIMICVFGAFALGDLRVLRLFGLGMAAAILIDATLVRLVLMPAILQTAGRVAWWTPQWIERTVPSFIAEHPQPPEPSPFALATTNTAVEGS